MKVMPEFCIIKNALSKEELDMVFKEVEEHKAEFLEDKKENTYNYDRWYPLPTNKISSIVDKLIFGKRVKKKIKKYNGYIWYLLRNGALPEYEVQLTRYSVKAKNEYGWHQDGVRTLNNHLRVFNYIIYLSTPEKGGELDISYNEFYEGCDGTIRTKLKIKLDLVIKPEFNKLVIMPCNLPHKVRPTEGKITRLTLNGHLNA